LIQKVTGAFLCKVKRRVEQIDKSGFEMNVFELFKSLHPT